MSGPSGTEPDDDLGHGMLHHLASVKPTHTQTEGMDECDMSSIRDYHKVKQWIETKVLPPGEELGEDMWEWAHDGKLLCKLAHEMDPDSINMKDINKRSGVSSSFNQFPVHMRVSVIRTHVSYAQYRHCDYSLQENFGASRCGNPPKSVNRHPQNARATHCAPLAVLT